MNELTERFEYDFLKRLLGISSTAFMKFRDSMNMPAATFHMLNGCFLMISLLPFTTYIPGKYKVSTRFLV